MQEVCQGRSNGVSAQLRGVASESGRPVRTPRLPPTPGSLRPPARDRGNAYARMQRRAPFVTTPRMREEPPPPAWHPNPVRTPSWVSAACVPEQGALRRSDLVTGSASPSARGFARLRMVSREHPHGPRPRRRRESALRGAAVAMVESADARRGDHSAGVPCFDRPRNRCVALQCQVRPVCVVVREVRRLRLVEAMGVSP